MLRSTAPGHENVPRTSGREHSSVIELANTNFDSLAEFLAQLDTRTVQEIVKTIRSKVESQKLIIQLAELLIRETEIKFQAQSEESDTSSELTPPFQHLKELSVKHGGTYPKLKKHFEEWKKMRQNLIKKSKSGAQNLDLYFKCACFCRLLGSSVDIIGTAGGSYLNSINSDWAKYAFMAASSFGFLGLVATVSEVAMSKIIHDDMSNSIKNDQEKFKPIEKWFKQTKDLDNTVRKIFPYGINKDLVRDIEGASNLHDDYLKIFEATLVTNAEKDPQLFTDKEFLKKVLKFSRDKMALDWWKRVLIMEHPVYLETSKIYLNNSMRQTEAMLSQSIPAFTEMTKHSTSHFQAKCVLNGLTIFDAMHGLKKDVKSKTSDLLRDLETKTSSEFEAIEDIVQKLKPK